MRRGDGIVECTASTREIPADIRAQQPDLPLRGKAVTQQNAARHIGIVAGKCRAAGVVRAVAEFATRAIELAANFRGQQSYLPLGAEAFFEKHIAGDVGSVE
ncbi:MAG: hypothetical protein V3V97_11395, partial [Hyphomicrobiaceae bacterium]